MGDFIEFDSVYYTYDELEDESAYTDNLAVSDISLSIKEGDFVAIIGRNGSGKSTLAKLTNGLIIPNEGTVLVSGIQSSDDQRIYELRKNVGMVFQNPDNQIIGTSVEEDVAFGPENLGIEHKEMVERVDSALKYTGLIDLRYNEPHYLSGGQKQRVAIAGILAMKPKCIVLDEATSMLDPVGRREVLSLVKKLNKEENITIIHITHHMDELELADKVFLIDSGRIIMEGTPKEIFMEKDILYKAGLEVPQVTLLIEELIKEGIDLPKDIISVEEAYTHIKALMEA